MSTSRPARPFLLLLVQILSFSAVPICFWLFFQKLNGSISSIAGCGGEGGCSQVMGGRWSEWFHVPVTLCAGLVYLGIGVLTLPPVQRALGRTGDQLLAAGGVILAGAAVYFLSLMFFDKKHGGFCPWCLGLHITGLTVSGLILTNAVRARHEGERGVLEAAMLTGFAAIGMLAAGQIWGPRVESHLITDGGLLANAGSARPDTVVPPPAAKSESRELSFFDGELKFDAAALPILGSPDTRFVLVEFFDYTCRTCRVMSGHLKELQQKWPGMFSVVVLPAPLHRECNPFLKANVPDHAGACELAKLSLGVWKARPEVFAEYHDYLLQLPLPIGAPGLQEARRKADDLAGAPAVTAALEDSWVANRLTENLGTFAKLTAQSIVMPKLLLHSQLMMHGPARNVETFLKVMDEQFHPAEAGTPVVTPAK